MGGVAIFQHACQISPWSITRLFVVLTHCKPTPLLYNSSGNAHIFQSFSMCFVMELPNSSQGTLKFSARSTIPVILDHNVHALSSTPARASGNWCPQHMEGHAEIGNLLRYKPGYLIRSQQRSFSHCHLFQWVRTVNRIYCALWNSLLTDVHLTSIFLLFKCQVMPASCLIQCHHSTPCCLFGVDVDYVWLVFIGILFFFCHGNNNLLFRFVYCETALSILHGTGISRYGIERDS